MPDDPLFPSGCQTGRLAEDGRIPDRYPLTELPGTRGADRTRRNVEDSDGTLIIHFGQLTGTALTAVPAGARPSPSA